MIWVDLLRKTFEDFTGPITCWEVHLFSPNCLFTEQSQRVSMVKFFLRCLKKCELLQDELERGRWLPLLWPPRGNFLFSVWDSNEDMELSNLRN